MSEDLWLGVTKGILLVMTLALANIFVWQSDFMRLTALPQSLGESGRLFWLDILPDLKYQCLL